MEIISKSIWFEASFNVFGGVQGSGRRGLGFRISVFVCDRLLLSSDSNDLGPALTQTLTLGPRSL